MVNNSVFNNMFDELKKINYFKEITDFKSLILQCKILLRNKTLKESSRSRGVFGTQTSLYDRAFCEYT